jgi:hypothetical protein
VLQGLVDQLLGRQSAVSPYRRSDRQQAFPLFASFGKMAGGCGMLSSVATIKIGKP